MFIKEKFKSLFLLSGGTLMRLFIPLNTSLTIRRKMQIDEKKLNDVMKNFKQNELE